MVGMHGARFEKLARGVAQGQTVRAAAIAAGWGETNRCYQVARRKEFKARVGELRELLEWGGAQKLGPVIDELKVCAQEARDLKSAAGMNAARGLLAAVAELKRLPRTDEAGGGEDRELTLKQWAAQRGATS
jgi:hypothetical protein